MMDELRTWAETADDTGPGDESEQEWQDIGRKVEAKIRRKLKKWAEED